MELSMKRRKYKNGSGYIPCHYIIAMDWKWKKVKDLNIAAWWTLNRDINLSSIQIEVIGNMNKSDFTVQQKTTLIYLIKEIEKKYWKQKILWHQEVGKTSCPWVYGMKYVKVLREFFK